MSDQVLVNTADGIELSANVFHPPTSSSATVLFTGGVGVPQEIYQPLAEWLASHALRCVTFDYRGSGESRRTQRAILSASLTSWASRDAAAIFEYVESNWQEPVVLIAHSFGGQLLAISEPFQRLRAAVLIASQCGTPRYWTGFQRLRIFLMWHFLLPIGAKLWKETPAWLGFQLPSGVAREWASWGRQSDYLFSLFADAERRIKRFPAPVLAYSIDDDNFAPKAATDALIDRFDPMKVSKHSIDPSKSQPQRIGHFGVFKTGRTPDVWEAIHEFLVDQVSTVSSPSESAV